jgi:hypothetical protein
MLNCSEKLRASNANKWKYEREEGEGKHKKIIMNLYRAEKGSQAIEMSPEKKWVWEWRRGGGGGGRGGERRRERERELELELERLFSG